MRVICIDPEAWPDKRIVQDFEGDILESMETYDVTYMQEEYGYLWYEISADPGYVYYSGCFLPLSDGEELEKKEAMLEKLQS